MHTESFPANKLDRKLAERTAVILLYTQNKSQREIADCLGLDPIRVFRIINKALSEQELSVRYELKKPLPKHEELSKELRELFPKAMPHRDPIVVPLGPMEYEDRLAAVSRMAAFILEDVLKDNVTFAIDGGESVASVIGFVRKIGRRLKLFPVAGGPLISIRTSVATIIGRFLGACGQDRELDAYLLPEPLADKNGRNKQKQNSIDALRQQAAQADVFLLGVGTIGRVDTSTAKDLIHELQIDKSALKEVIGVSGYNAFNVHGQYLETQFDKKVTKVTAQELQTAARSKDRTVLLAAIGTDKAGTDKAQAIRSLIMGGWVNVLVTDAATAEAILKLQVPPLLTGRNTTSSTRKTKPSRKKK